MAHHRPMGHGRSRLQIRPADPAGRHLNHQLARVGCWITDLLHRHVPSATQYGGTHDDSPFVRPSRIGFYWWADGPRLPMRELIPFSLPSFTGRLGNPGWDIR